jgi:hypothetical protein
MQMPRLSKAIAVMAVAMVATVGMTACSSNDDNGDTGNGAEVGQVIGPVIVEPDQSEVTVAVGRTVVFNAVNPQDTVATSDNTSVVSVTDGYDDGSAIFNPGAEALAAGTATVTLTDTTTGTDWVVQVTVTE